MSFADSSRTSVPNPSSPISIRGGNITPPDSSPIFFETSKSYEPTSRSPVILPHTHRRGSLSPPSSHYNGVPKIAISNSRGYLWNSGDIPQIHAESPTPPSTVGSRNSSYCDLTPQTPNDSCHSLSDLKVGSSMDQRSLSHGDIRPKKTRRKSFNIFRSEEAEISSQLAISSTRFCVSQDSLDKEENASSSRTGKLKRKVKKKFLAVEENEGYKRNRSASTGEVMYLPSSKPQSKSRVKKLLRRLRSRSQGDIEIPPNLKPSSVASSREDLDDPSFENYPDPHAQPHPDFEPIPATAINTSLLSRIKRNMGGSRQPRKMSAQDIYQIKSQRRNSDFLNNNEKNLYVTIEHPESTEDLRSSQGSLYKEHLSPHQQRNRIRSNSETQFIPDFKPKKKSLLDMSFVSRLKNRQKQKKRDRSGSLPNVLDDDIAIQHFRDRKVSVIPDGSRQRSVTYSDRGDTDKSVYMGDFAIDDYFGENGESLSMENLMETDPHIRKVLSRPRQRKYSFDNLLNTITGKSRSMDYTLQRPFDLEHLKRKLGDRTSSEPSRDFSDPSEVGVGGKGDLASADRRGPPKTYLSGPVISYSVQANDTLMSIAARFDTTPSELTKINRLTTRFLFPGQILHVPDKGGAKENLGDFSKEGDDIYKDQRSSPTSVLSDLAPPKSPQNYPRTPANSVETDRSLDKECLEKFLKIQVRHITDGQGVVAGVLLVTPNAVMFDPNVSDPLVIERGSESYGVIAPMDFVVNAALYYDIAHMKVKDTGLPRPEIPKPEIYYGPPQPQEQTPEEDEQMIAEAEPSDRLTRADGQGGVVGTNEESPSKDATFPELTSNDNDNDSTCSCGGETRETSAFPKAFEHELLTPISSDASPTAGESSAPGLHPPPPPPPPGQTELAPTDESDKTETKRASPSTQPLPPPVDSGDAAPSPTPAQNTCDIKPGAEVSVQKKPVAATTSLPPTSTPSAQTNDKKRTTSVTFNTSSESDMPPLLEDENVELPSQESRKQKVLKRISYPLTWMESFSGESKEGQLVGQAQQQGIPSSAPPSNNWVGSTGGTHPAGELSDANRPGMFSNVFSMSNVSNMLTRRTSLDFTRRPPASQGSDSPNPPMSSSPVPEPPQQPPPSGGSAHQAQKRMQFKEGPKFGLKSMVSMDEMPDLFASFDKLIPKPASTCDESPLYLCLRMGTPTDKAIPRSTPIMTYGRKTMRPEYWFSIPKNRTDELYHFFQTWASEIYGELEEEVVNSRGFTLIEEEIEIWPQGSGEGGFDGGLDHSGELKEITKESWEVASMSEELRKALNSSSLTSLDIEAFLPEILGTSEVINDSIRKNMYRKLPARVQGYNWKLVFSSSQHGFSLKSLYRKMSEIESPIIIFIQDTNQMLFGAFLSSPFKVSDLFYGNGESFLFSCQPEFKVYPWSGENNFFVKGNNESLVIGGGDGKFGIWLDGDLYQGRSQPCQTYGNPILSSSEDFIIKTIECWYFE